MKNIRPKTVTMTIGSATDANSDTDDALNCCRGGVEVEPAGHTLRGSSGHRHLPCDATHTTSQQQSEKRYCSIVAGVVTNLVNTELVRWLPRGRNT
jgi:hypothetical protein